MKLWGKERSGRDICRSLSFSIVFGGERKEVVLYVWADTFDNACYTRRACEAQMNSFPNFTSSIEDKGDTFRVHFVALFSSKPDAVPLLCLHGWPGTSLPPFPPSLPLIRHKKTDSRLIHTHENLQKPGSFLEFLPMLSLARAQYPTPHALPYHLIVPSLPGYAFSTGPPAHRSLTTLDSAAILDKLMTQRLPFSQRGYVATGGDVGASMARILGAGYGSCKGVHINFCPLRSPPPAQDLESEEDRALAARGAHFLSTGSAYAFEHGTRPATIGLALSASPLSLLAWVGEKFLAWSDLEPPLPTILEAVSLYWFTGTISRCLYPYRQFYEGVPNGHEHPSLYLRGKKFGYSLFAKELVPSPRAWVESTGELSFYRRHERGGHFAALERPSDMWRDLEEFLAEGF